ncbi:hypothetical protein RI054_24g102280 [Pseudoscourfieldia marina]
MTRVDTPAWHRLMPGVAPTDEYEKAAVELRDMLGTPFENFARPTTLRHAYAAGALGTATDREKIKNDTTMEEFIALCLDAKFPPVLRTAQHKMNTWERHACDRLAERGGAIKGERKFRIKRIRELKLTLGHTELMIRNRHKPTIQVRATNPDVANWELKGGLKRTRGVQLESECGTTSSISGTVLGIRVSVNGDQITFTPTAERCDKLKSTLETVVEQGVASDTLARSIQGKLIFLLTASFGRIGKASVARLAAAPTGARTQESTEAAQQLINLIEKIREIPRRINLRVEQRQCAVLFTDASGFPTHGIGVVVFVPGIGFRHGKLRPKLTAQVHINILEAAAACVGRIFLDNLADNAEVPVLHFVDSEAAKGALIKGRSPSAILNECAGAYHELPLPRHSWIEFVPSRLNPADIPSRDDGDCTVLARLGSTESNLPPIPPRIARLLPT